MSFDEVFLNPAPAELIACLRDAVAAVGRLSKKAPKPLPPEEEERLLWELAAADGAFAHHGNGKLCLSVAWWTDPVGRKHVRVASRIDDEQEADEDVPAVCRVYPGSLLVVEADGEETVSLVVCGCGAIGTPAAIAWMGETCGPCADAKADGQTVPPPLIVRGVGGGSGVMKATADGRGLVLATTEERLAYLDLRTGERIISKPTRGETLRGIALAPDGESCLAGYWSNHLVRWNWRNNAMRRHGEPLVYSQFHVSPNDTHAVTDGSGTLLRIDWNDARTPLKLVGNFAETRHGGFTRDGAKWVGLSEEYAFVENDLLTGSRRALRRDAFDELSPDIDQWQYEMLQVQQLDADYGWAIVAFADSEHGIFGPARLGPVAMPGDWRELPFDDDGMSDNNMPDVFGFTPDGEYALYRDEAGRLVFFPTEEEGETIHRLALPATEDGLQGLTFSPDGKTLHAAVSARGMTLIASIPWRQVLAAVRPVR